jgi:mRNA interferase MazF
MAKGPRITHPRRGEVYLTSFDPTTGAEIKKTRPALILQNDIANQHSPITVVAAITSKFDDPLIRPKFLSGR